MTDPRESLAKAEEQLIADARRRFEGFFRWAGVLDDMIKNEIGPEFGLAVKSIEASVVEQRVSGLLDLSRRFKPPMEIPFSVQGETIALSHPKFEREDEETGEKSSAYDVSAIHEVNRILGDVVQDYIG